MAPQQIPQVDTSNCESEPIRFSGAVQPHGALLVLQRESGIIEAASQSCEALLGRSAQSLLGHRLGEIFEPEFETAVLADPIDGSPSPLTRTRDGRQLSARSSLNLAGQILFDLEPAEPDASLLHGLTYRRRRGIEALRRLADVAEIAQSAAELLRAITGFDQVMIYRFDATWNGEVIAEARAAGVEPYLGLNFPASDIPRQARELFQFCKVRLIPDVHYVPSALLARADSLEIDLGRSSLRSVSPIHIEYLKNMGARATLVCALVVEGRLWGLLSCQQKEAPKYFSPAQRDALGWLCEDIAALIEARLIREGRAHERSLALRRQQLIEAIRARELKALMRPQNNADLLGVVGADGFALVIDDTIATSGRVPAVARIRELYRRRAAREPASTLFASSALNRDLGLDDAEDGVAGALFVSVLRKPVVTMIWFRAERRYAVNWGGDPEHPHVTDERGRISPRRSFSLFLQEVRGESLPWSAEELTSAVELVALIEIEALREQEALSQTILNSMPEHISVLDARGVIVMVNNSWKRFAEANDAPELAESSAGISYRDICTAAVGHPGDDQALAAWAGIEAVLSKRCDTFSLDYPCDSPSVQRWFRMSVNPMLAPAEGVVVVHENVTPRKLAEQALIASEQRYHGLLEDQTELICRFQADGTILYVNDAFCRYFGKPFETLVGHRWQPVAWSGDLPLITERLGSLSPANSVITIENRVVAADGSMRWGQFVNRAFFDEKDTLLEIQAVGRDITDRKEAEAQVDRLMREQQAILDSQVVGIVKIQDRRIVWANAAFARMLGYAADELIGQPMRIAYPSDDGYEEFGRLAAASLARGELLRTEMQQRRKDGTLGWFDISVARLSSDSATLIGAFVDVTELYRTKETAEAANIAKSRFLAMMSHEIRTPMNSILGMAQVLLTPGLKEAERHDYTRTVLSSGQTLLKLLDDILDFSKVEAGRLELESVSLDPGQILDEIRSLFAQVALRKGLGIASAWRGPVGQCYLGDAHRLRQMLSNLVNNAIKFTPQGQIHIQAREVVRGQKTAVVEFAVSDTGIGIAENQRQALFQPFSQVDNSQTRQYGGTGLGLSIVRDLAHRMGGEVGVESEIGRGSRFWFRIQAGLPAPDEDRPVAAGPGQSGPSGVFPQLVGRVLVVEDTEDGRKVAEAILKTLGLTVVQVEDGAQCSDAIMGGDEADLVLMDVHTPVMSGYAAAARIRQWEAQNARTRRPIIALTADASQENRRRCLAAGMDEFLTKPIAIDTLAATLAKYLRPAVAPSPPTAAPIPTAKAVDARRITAMVAELEPLLAGHRFDAVGQFRALQETLAETAAAADIAHIGQLVTELRFDVALQQLRRIAVARGWKDQT